MAMLTPERKADTMKHAKRFGGWWLLAILPLIAVLFIAPQQGEILLYKVTLVAVAVLLGYWADRVIFENAPDVNDEMPRDVVSGCRLVARAVIFLAIQVAVTMGV